MLLLFSSSWHGTFLCSSPHHYSHLPHLLSLSVSLSYISNYLLLSSAQMMVAGNLTPTPSMDLAAPPPPPPSQQSLRCPRCDSSNTKFCYYNNYSLAQPRHFCKACKRYWTRGGTLRNVPVGGGCRKNKRVKKPTSSSSSSVAALSIPPRHSLPAPPHLSLPANSAVDFNPLLFGFTTAASSSPSDVNLPSLPSFLGYPDNHEHNEYQRLSLCNDFSHPLQQSSVLDNYPLLGSSLSTALLVSSLKQPKKVQEFQAMLPYHDSQNAMQGDMGSGLRKDVKVEDDAVQVHCGDPLETMPVDATGDDPASSNFYWNSSITAWPDPASFGSSLAPLI